MSREITFGSQVCGNLAEGAQREWLVADGLGGYAMGTVSGLRTRRYHAMLTVAGSHPGERYVGLVALDPIISTRSGASIRLGVHEWSSGSVSPEGHTRLERFELIDGVPSWRFRVGELVLERQLAMVNGRPALGAVYRLISGGPAHLSVEALCTWREAHGDRRDTGSPLRMDEVADGIVVEGAYRLAGPGWVTSGQWYQSAHLRDEATRGLIADEDLWLAGAFHADLRSGETLEVGAWAGDLEDRPPPAASIVAGARSRAARIIAASGASDDVGAALALAADSFVVRRDVPDAGSRPDVIAGYPWFGPWSRDTMTSYEGLFLATNRFDDGRDLLRGYAATVSGGMLANTADTGALEYNTADATLWFLHAIGRHVERAGDVDLAGELIADMRSIIEAHMTGVRHGIRVDPADGLLTQGAAGLALTWMDARVHGRVITPRVGKPVEVNALWVNALATVAALGGRVGAEMSDVAAAHDRARASFQTRFANGVAGLFDVIDGPAGNDPAARPNQLLAYSLPYAPMDGPAPNLDALVTPLGLRTLDPADPAYRGRHRGDQVARDEAYHQGTVWPWLIGPYVDACRRVPGVDCSQALDGLLAHLGDYGLGSVSETADGDAPHGATGCPFQAWSVAELLRARRS